MTGADALAELLAVTVQALEAATDELDMLNDPDECAQEAMCTPFEPFIREHEAMAQVIRRIARSAPPERKRRLGAMCREALDDVRWLDMPNVSVPVMDETLTQARDALEVVRRRALVDDGVRDALAEIPPPHSFFPAGA